MKILISAYACIPHRGSEPGNGWNWTFENARLGHSVWCVTTPAGKEAISKELKKYPYLDISFTYVEVSGWLNYMSRLEPFAYLRYIDWQRKASYEALRVDREQDFDLVHHVSLGSFQLGSEMWRLNKPFIFGPVGGGSFPPVAFKKYFYGGWKTEVIRKWTSNLLLILNRNIHKISRKAALIVVANSDTYKMAKKTGASRIELHPDIGLPGSFFPDELPLREGKDVLKLLWVGRIFPRKGLPLVLEALSKVRRDVPFQLTIIGDGNLGRLVPGFIKQYGLEDKAEWLGQVPWATVREAYLSHHAFMFCSLRDTTGVQLLEAMAFALPIITLNHQGAGDNVPDSASIKVDVTTPDETTEKIAAAVEYLFDYPKVRDDLGRRGFEYAKQHSWDSKAKWLSQFYPEITKSGGQ